MEIKINQPLCFSELGQKPNQEDTLFPLEGRATEKTRVFLVCDGMGGHEHGEVASQCVAASMGKQTTAQVPCSVAEMQSSFEHALEKTYQELDELDQSSSPRKMGTTLTFLAFCTDGVLIAHIGDSRVYQFRPERGILFQTKDHSLVNDLVASGEITEAEAAHHPQKNVITRAIQPHQDYPVKASFKVLRDVRPGDLFFLCCDGVLEQLENTELTKILLAKQNLKERLDTLRKECARRKTRDNHSCYLIQVKDSITIDKTEETVIPKKKGSFWKIILIILILAGLATLYGSLRLSQKEKQNTSQETEHVQGTITRQNK